MVEFNKWRELHWQQLQQVPERYWETLHMKLCAEVYAALAIARLVLSVTIFFFLTCSFLVVSCSTLVTCLL